MKLKFDKIKVNFWKINEYWRYEFYVDFKLGIFNKDLKKKIENRDERRDCLYLRLWRRNIDEE